MQRLFLILCLLWPGSALAETGLRVDRQSAVILAYQRVGDDSFPAANIRTDQFAAHMRFLKEEGYHVVPIANIIHALKNGSELPDKTVAITFDGGHRSILEHATPLLEKYGFPYTIFTPRLNVQPDNGDNIYMQANALKELAGSGLATIALQSSMYAHLQEVSDVDLKRYVNTSRAEFRDVMGYEPILFAYPFGEVSQFYRNFIEAQGFEAAFGLQSGAASPASDVYALPRFSMTEDYADLERFETAVSALPLPISGLEPADPYLTNPQPAIGFTLPEALVNREDFACFASGTPDMDMQKLGNGRIELRFASPLTSDRLRINCTITQGTDDPEKPYRWRWLGLLYTVQTGNAEEDDLIE